MILKLIIFESVQFDISSCAGDPQSRRNHQDQATLAMRNPRAWMSCLRRPSIEADRVVSERDNGSCIYAVSTSGDVT